MDKDVDELKKISNVQLGLGQCLKYSEGMFTTVFYDDVFFGVTSQ